jgi:hypothetical protein
MANYKAVTTQIQQTLHEDTQVTTQQTTEFR